MSRRIYLSAGALIALAFWALALMGDGMPQCQAAGTSHDACYMAINP